MIKKTHPGVDSEARYLKKGNKLHYGYKKQVLTDENGIQLSVQTTAANEHDNKGLKPCLENQDEMLAIMQLFLPTKVIRYRIMLNCFKLR